MSRKILLISLAVVLATALVSGFTMAFWTSEGDAGGPAHFESGTVTISAGSSMIFGVEADTGDLYEIDVSTGAKYLLFDETISTSSGSTSNYVNALAFDRKNNRLYYTPKNNQLYFYDFNSETYAGQLDGGRTAGATFGRGYYWYVPQGTDDLRQVSFKTDGTIQDDELFIKAFASKKFNFGDIAMDIQSNVLYGSGASGGSRIYFKIDLDTKTYTQIATGAPHHMQVAFGTDGLLYGHATEGTGSAGNSRGWHVINNLGTGASDELDWSPGERNFNDLASNWQNNWNPGDCDMMRYFVTNVGSKNVHVKLTLVGSWYDVPNSNIEYQLCNGMVASEWAQVNNTFYYLPDVPPGGIVKLCVLVCLDGPGTGNEYQGLTFTLQATANAIQASNYAPYHVWGVTYYGTPPD